MRNHVTSETPESHIWCMDSAVQRAARLSDAALCRGGFVSQPNSVTQNWTGCAETIWWVFTPAFSNARILGRSPSSTSSGFFAFPNGPPNVYGWCDQASKCTGVVHVACGCAPFERQRKERMNASGDTECHLCFLLFGWANGSSPPATTMFVGSTACTASATALTIARYVLPVTGFRSRLRLGSFHTWNTCSAGTPGVRPW